MTKRIHFQVQRVLYVVILVSVSFYLVSPFIIPILLAGSIALALYPLQIKLVKKGWQRRFAAALLTTIFTFLISIPFIFFIAKGTMVVTEQLQELALGDRLQNEGMQSIFRTLKHDVIDKVMGYVSKFPMASFLTEAKLNAYLKSINTFLLDFFQNFAASIPTVTLFLLVMIFCTFSFLKNAGGVRNFFQSVFGFSNRKMDQLVGIFLRDARQVYFSNIVTGALQSILVATGVYFVTKADWFLVFFVTLIFSFIPVIGAAPMAFLFALISFVQGNRTGAVILLVLGTFTGVVDNFLRPWLASFGQTKAPPIVSFVFVIGGALILGFPGLFLGLLLGGIVYDTLPLFWDEIGKTEPTKNISGFFNFGDKNKEGREPTH